MHKRLPYPGHSGIVLNQYILTVWDRRKGIDDINYQCKDFKKGIEDQPSYVKKHYLCNPLLGLTGFDSGQKRCVSMPGFGSYPVNQNFRTINWRK